MIELSIVIPTYNRAKHLRVCLEALNRQTQAAGEFEVVVVIDGSTDKTIEMLKCFEARYLVRSIRQENSGQASALNRGILEAEGRYILFLDDDIVADPQLVAAHLQAHHQHQKAVVIGQITLSLPQNTGWYANAFAQGWRDHYDRLNREMSKLTWEDCYSGNMSITREALLMCGGFEVSLIRGYDVELASRLEKQGYSLIYMPNALGCQEEEKGFRQLSRDAQNAGKVDILLYREDPPRLTQSLASFAQGSWRKLLLRRLLLMFHIPPSWLEFIGRFMKSPAHRYSLYSVIQTLYYWRGVRQSAGSALWRQLTYGTPILMYHAIGYPHESAGPYVMPAHRFVTQMTWLKRMGYLPITLKQFLDCQRDRRPVPVGSVVITFDDGYTDNYTHADPILQQQNIPATIFLVSGYIGLANKWDEQKQLSGRPLMSWSQIQELKEHGVQFGAHTCTHPILTAISSDRAEEEITLSRKQLESRLVVPVDHFAYPYGEHDSAVQDMVRQAGFTAGCTVDAGLNTLITPIFSLHRVEIRGTDSLARFLLSLWMGDAEALGWRRGRKQ
jgi:glycosyltransferase involved in cell wall biosynthesis/peptidoglycan/xylan/chitin deacetylase (PgdA/CDA1 family)